MDGPLYKFEFMSSPPCKKKGGGGVGHHGNDCSFEICHEGFPDIFVKTYLPNYINAI